MSAPRRNDASLKGRLAVIKFFATALLALVAPMFLHVVIGESWSLLSNLPAEPQASGTLLNFEDLPNATVVTNQYGTRGVHFRNAMVVNESFTHSGSRVLYSGNPTDEFNPGPLIIDFAAGQRSVKLYAGTPH